MSARSQMRQPAIAVAIWFLLLAAAPASQAASSGSWKPIQLSPYPQKLRTFYSLQDTNVPPGLHSNATPPLSVNITAQARATDGAIWLGTTQGLVRLDLSSPPRDRQQYLAGQRYLPDDAVQQILPDAQGGVWVCTRTGVAHIQIVSLTLAQKAGRFEAAIRQRHDRYGLVSDSQLTVPGDLRSNQKADNDNDGLWTSLYGAAECFRYAVTQSPEALANARKSVEALLFLEEVAGQRGFPARSYIRAGDRMPTDGEWHWTADGKYYWKGDTSSDEIVGHFFLFSVAYDLLPDVVLRQRIATTSARIMDHILRNQYTLVDLDGQPTRWGWWSRDRLALSPEETALNSLQLLSFLKTTAHITGDARYAAEYRKVANDLQYTNLVTRLNEFRTELNYSDEELAMLPFYCLFQYERDPALLAVYRRALADWWRNMQRELNPLWTFIYLTGQPDGEADLPGAVWMLYGMPLDLIQWDVKNSHRTEISWSDRSDRFGRREALTLLPPDERPVMRWNGNPFEVDGGNGGRSEGDGGAFLLPYWLGRHHRFLLGE
jgi:hypothetical protein